jgi:hypothetical protein
VSNGTDEEETLSKQETIQLVGDIDSDWDKIRKLFSSESTIDTTITSF